MRPVTFAVHILTSPARRDLVVQTVGNLAASDLESSPHLHVDLSTEGPSRTRIAMAYGEMLEVAASSTSDFVLLLEDQIQANRFLRHNLSHWRPVADGTLSLGSLVAPDVAHLPGYLPKSGDEHSFLAEGRTVLGAHSLILSHRFVSYAAAHWKDSGSTQSRRLLRLASEFGTMAYHAPSLVYNPAIDGPPEGHSHGSAADFDLEWRAR